MTINVKQEIKDTLEEAMLTWADLKNTPSGPQKIQDEFLELLTCAVMSRIDRLLLEVKQEALDAHPLMLGTEVNRNLRRLLASAEEDVVFLNWLEKWCYDNTCVIEDNGELTDFGTRLIAHFVFGKNAPLRDAIRQFKAIHDKAYPDGIDGDKS